MKNNNYNRYIKHVTRSCNYDIKKYKMRKMSITSIDIIITGVISFLFAPMKRKINTKKEFDQSSSSIGRNYHNYDENSCSFFIDNKLQVIHTISNRSITVIELTFRRYDGQVLKIGEKSERLNVKTIMDVFRDFCGEHLPQNIITDDPVICQLFHSLITQFLPDHPKDVNVHYILNVELRDNNNDIFSKLKSRTLKYKTRTVKTSKRSSDRSSNAIRKDCCNIINGRDKRNNYRYHDQAIVFNDCCLFDYPKIYINIAPRYIIDKNYFLNKTIENNRGTNFVSDEFRDQLQNGLKKYLFVRVNK